MISAMISRVTVVYTMLGSIFNHLCSLMKAVVSARSLLFFSIARLDLNIMADKLKSIGETIETVGICVLANVAVSL